VTIRSTIKAPPIYKVAVCQAVIALLISVSAWVIDGRVSAYSLLIGSLISVIPGIWFASRVFKYRGARSASLIAREAKRGEAGKIALCAVGFALSFIYVKPLNVVALFSGFVLIHLVGLVSFALFNSRRSDKS
jgi:ATP synthase protein I